jgi:antitoxin component YwqK of YwqJK toxin-antitoxin module
MRYLLIAVLFISLTSEAQWKSYSFTPRHDTINRVDLKGLKQGPWVVHVDALRGEDGYDEQGIFIDDKRERTWKRFSLEGDLIAVENYYLGMKTGKCQYYLNTGEILREESWRAIDPKNPYDTVAIYDINDPSKIVRKEIIKIEPTSYKNGTWTYYNNDGTIASTEEWMMNKRKEEVAITNNNNNDELAPIDPATGKPGTNTVQNGEKKPVAKPKEVAEFEKKNSGKKKVKVRDGSTGG